MRGYLENNLLFFKHNGFAVIENQCAQLRKEVAALPEQRLLGTSVEDLVNYFVEKYRIDVPVLAVDEAAADQREAPVEVSGFRYGLDRGDTRTVPGTQVTLEIPFSGDAEMFRVRPSTFNTAPPYAEIRGQTLILRESGTQLSTDQVQADFDRTIADINQYLDWQRRDVTQLNGGLAELARSEIEARKAKLISNQNLVSGLKFKLKDRADAPRTYTAPVHRKRIEPRLPPASTAPFKPEPVLAEEDYNNILKIIQDMAMVMERSPDAFTHMSEEDLRQHFLVQLNGHYEGKATGETFNAAGKTDILIRHDGRNIFIAECKFWRGEKSFLSTIDQVLSYLSWRDTKVSVLVFNKNRDFSNVLAKIKEIASSHPLYKTGPKTEAETRFRYVFGQPNDTSREVVVTVLAFDVPQPKTTDPAEPKIRQF